MEREVLLILIGMSVVTYIPRMLPMVLLSRVELPDWFQRWLSYIPVAVLSALLAPALFLPDGQLSISLGNKELLASLPCFIVAAKTRNLFLTVSVGIVVMMLLGLF